ncbi:S8 family serine peptidase [Flammeovirga sp. SubArs3]|uniref:S8 family serine peptidase n=1 Tax=Flammeovirga sp. SubArs3 TaxID=2995316 RepID=UPI00248C8D70|nr:S8 family serine peptidase [Flammeovirga sp. SubArs3]
MKKLSLFSLLLLFCLMMGLHPNLQAQQRINNNYSFNTKGEAKGVVRIKFRPQSIPKIEQQVSVQQLGQPTKLGLAAFDVVSTQVNAHDLKRVFPYHPKFEDKLVKHGLHLWYQIEVDPQADIHQVLSAYNSVAEVDISEAILEKKLIGGEAGTYVLSNDEITNITAKSTSIQSFDDPLLADQWHYFNDGTNGKLATAGIYLDKAWEEVTGTSNVIVSIHDEGIDVKHEDLVNNMWINEAELNGTPGVDDDGNGYIDDVYGFNFATNSGVIDPQTHGTHVAGTVAATNNNGIGVAGVAGGSGNNDGIRLMSCQILGGQSAADIAQSYVYAANNGAVISQNSWGYRNIDSYEQSVLDAIDYFIEEAGDYEGSPMKGGIVIFASGNSNVDAKMYPGYYDKVLAVSSTGSERKKASYSNFGSWVDISAPGGDQNTYGNSHGVLSTLPSDNYGYLQGTSMACPHVSGVAALIVSKMGGEDFTPDILWNQLIYSVQSLEDDNPDYLGKMGTGLIDASIAIKENSGIAPNKVTDIALYAISNDFAKLQWTTPTDEDDTKPSKYLIQVSEGAFDDATAQRLFAFTSLEAGEVMNYMLEDLKSETTYSIVITVYDRWGNASEASEIFSLTTNNGPSLDYPKVDFEWQNAIEMSGNINDGETVETDFVISNTNDALLYWDIQKRQKAFSVKTWSAISFDKKVVKGDPIQQFEAVPFREVFEEEKPNDKLTPFKEDWLAYTDAIYASFVIGEEDLSKSHTTVAAYRVENENGFNLTSLDVFTNEITHGEVTVEVYHGPIFSEAKLVLSKKIEDKTIGPKYIYLENGESYYFQHNDVVWLKVHYPKGNQYPFGVSDANDHPDASRYQWLSFDEGQTYQVIEDAIGKPNYSFTQGLVTRQEYQGDYLTITPTEGEINGEGEATIHLSADISKLKNGSVTTALIIQSNDQNNQGVRVNTVINVDGHTPALVVPGIVDFGAVQIGREKEVIVKLNNFGYGVFKGGITWEGLDGTAFELVSRPWNIAPRGTQDLVVKFTPTVTGNISGILTITDRDGHSTQVNFTGVGEAPSEINVTPQEQTLHLAHHSSTQSSITIENTGNYPLSFNIPKYSDKASEAGHKFGYAWEMKKEGFIWEELDGAEGAVDVSEQFKTNPFLDYVEVDLGFQFPFYDTLVTKMYMSHIGMVAVDEKDPVNGSFGQLLGKDFTSNGYFAIMYDYFDLLVDSKIIYKVFDDHVVFEWKNVHSRVTSFRSGDPMTFQLALYYDGQAQMRYLDLNWSNSNSIDPFVGVESPDKQDGFYIYEFVMAPELIFQNNYQNVWIDLKYPGPQIISNLSKTNGVVGVGQSLDITFDVSSEGLVDGVNTQNIAIENNDPTQPLAHFTVHVDVNGGGEAVIKTSNNSIDFGRVLKGTEKYDVITFLNEGNSDLDIVSATLMDGSKVTLEKTTFPLKARLGTTVKVYLDASEIGKIQDEITFSDENGETYIFDLYAEIAPSPAIDIADLSTKSFNLDHGDKTSFTIEISNVDGDTTLRMIPSGTHWLYQSELVESMNQTIFDFDYFMKDNADQLQGVDDHQAPTYQWIDITKIGGRKLDFSFTDLWAAVELEQPVKFYDKTYSKVWVGYPGIITFTEPTAEAPFWNSAIPKKGGIDNFIAPFWGLTGYDGYDEHPDKGMWYYADEEKTIISFERWVHAFGEGTGSYVHAQVIILNDGRIKMQYKTINQETVDRWNNSVVIGIENEDGSQGVQASYYTSYVTDGLVLEYTPARVINIAAGESKTIEFEVNAEELIAGNYYADLTFVNHTPSKENISLPIELTVNGRSDIMFSEDVIELGDIVYTPWMSTHYEFTIENNGTAHHQFTSTDIEGADKVGLEIYGLLEEIFPSPWPAIRSWYAFALVVDPFYKPTFAKVGESTPARIHLRPQGPGQFEETVILNKADGSTQQLLVKANFVLPPKFDMDEVGTMEVYAKNTDHKESKSFTIKNTEGNNPLEFAFHLDYQRVGETSVALNVPYSNVAPSSKPFISTYTLVDEIDQNDFNNILYYGDFDAENVNHIGFDGAQKLTTITKFVSPSEGFDLSHIATWYNPVGNDENGTIELTVMTGTAIEPVVIYQEELSVEGNQNEDIGVQLLQLKETVALLPNETFYIGLTYDQKAEYPQGMVELNENIPATFYIPLNNQWFDLSTDANFQTLGYNVKALAKDPIAGTWFSLDQTEGVIEMGEELEINAYFDAQYHVGEHSLKVDVSITTNDPSMIEEDAQFTAVMLINEGPQITNGEGELSLQENSTMVYSYVAKSMDGHAFTLAAEELPEWGNFEVNEDSIHITLSPTFEDEGEYIFTIIAEDEYGVRTEKAVSTSVLNTNRAPLSTTIDPIEVSISEVIYIDANELFTDEDQDVLTFGIADNNDGSILTGVNDQEFIITGLKEGTSEVAFMATDIHGASTLMVVEVTVIANQEDVTSIDADFVAYELSNYPNPVTSETTITFRMPTSGTVDILIHNVQGQLIDNLQLGGLNAGQHQLEYNTEKLTSGVYLYTLIIDGKPITFNRLVK